jgi:hypothetical protein
MKVKTIMKAKTIMKVKTIMKGGYKLFFRP